MEHNPRSRPPLDAPYGAAWEWLERERRPAQFAWPPLFAVSGAEVGKGAHINDSRVRINSWSTDWKVWASIVLAQQLLLTQFVSIGMALAIFLTVLALCQCARWHYKTYRLRKRANQADDSRGRTSDD